MNFTVRWIIRAIYNYEQTFLLAKSSQLSSTVRDGNTISG
jgi:hypothetical protein